MSQIYTGVVEHLEDGGGSGGGSGEGGGGGRGGVGGGGGHRKKSSLVCGGSRTLSDLENSLPSFPPSPSSSPPSPPIPSSSLSFTGPSFNSYNSSNSSSNMNGERKLSPPPPPSPSIPSTHATSENIVPLLLLQPRFANFYESTSKREVLLRQPSMEEVVARLHMGANLWKIRAVNKRFLRHYKVNVENMTLVGQSRKWWTTGGFSVPLLEVVEVRSGWKTDTFNKVSAHQEKLGEKTAATTTTTTNTTTSPQQQQQQQEQQKATTPSPSSSPTHTQTGGGGGAEEGLLEESCCFSIIYGGSGREVLDLVAETEEERDAWVLGLRHLVSSVHSLHQEKLYDVWLRRKFQEADKDNNGSLSFPECCKLLKQLNIKMDKLHAKKLFNQANTSKQKRDGEQVLEVDEFVSFYHALLKMPQVEALFRRYASDKTLLMNADQLLTFLTSEQGLTSLGHGEAEGLIRAFEISDLKDQGYMTQDGFYHMLLSDMFDVFESGHQKEVWQDMTRPLSHYYISSSHNTYLTGHQLAGESSVEGYISALKKGCRLLELDVWDGEDGNPIIYHGHTLTSKITLEDVLRDGVLAYAFHASPFPVILSIENHLSVEQQRVMVEMMESILGDKLLREPVSEDMVALPSPAALKHKIIVRGKKPQGVGVESDDEDDDQDAIDYIDSDDGASQSKKKPHKPLAPELTRVINVLEGRKFISLKDAFETFKPYNTPSIGEIKAKALLDTPEDFLRFTEGHVTKVYPLGTRTSSSNLKPYPFWSVGCQIVALNMQTEDKANFYNHALFRSNGGCGYVLKPSILLREKPYSPSEAAERPPTTIRVSILSGQHLPDSAKKGDIVDPYVQVKVRGHPDDHQKQRTKVVKNNGFNPVWNEDLELNIRVPEVSLIYFTVRDESSLAADPVLALCCIPFHSLGTGYRYVHLTDIRGKSLAPSALFVHVSVSGQPK